MAIIERSTTIRLPAAQVFSYVADVTRHPEWAGHKLEVRSGSSGAVQVGSKFETVGHQFGEQPGSVTVTELVPDRKIVYESDGPVGHFRHQFLVDDEGGGSVRLTKTMEPLKISSLPLKLLSPLVTAFIAPRGLDGDLARIKAKLEGGAPAPAMEAETPAAAPPEPSAEAPAAAEEGEERPPEGA
ncbi:MAG: SRPBCC family protein [Dehalococcoidia bacterium]